MTRPSRLIITFFTVTLFSMQVCSASTTAQLDHYLSLQQSLASDNLEGAKQAAQALSAKSSGQIKIQATQIAAASSIEKARTAFKPLSELMIDWAKKNKPTGVKAVRCTMAPGDWLQKEGEVQNPYYGKSMLTCGDSLSLK